LVDSLARHGRAVLFSAAVPNQGGDHHLNEQWPGYWAQRFAAHGLAVVDAIRPTVWDDDSIAWWYRQNTLLFCDDELIDSIAALREARRVTRDGQLAVVHPILHSWMAHQRDALAHDASRTPSFREAAGVLPRSASSALKRRLGRGT
jgi:hypothetical protein